VSNLELGYKPIRTVRVDERVMPCLGRTSTTKIESRPSEVCNPSSGSEDPLETKNMQGRCILNYQRGRGGLQLVEDPLLNLMQSLAAG
jgi:hypothetical protein